ncbi:MULTISPECIES: hypothetical protein [unclassified Streptomyces]|uniref:hypothetical protein n=1 Tax=unclassified Streptomyces TaxID=2593676 RepID=UPI00131D9E12|nr:MULTISPECIES: hypothetical protein [unclassified Streptomyces]
MPHTKETRSFRLGTMQVATPITLGIILATSLLYLGLQWNGDPMTEEELRSCAYAACAAIAFAVIWPRTRGVRLSPEGLETFKIFDRRSRFTPWKEVAGIDVRRTAGVSRVIIYLTSGESVALDAPVSFIDPKFNDKVAALNSYWCTYRH